MTVIDGGGWDSVVIFASGETENSVLTGFTITNGWALDGGGIRCRDGSSPAILRNTIVGNHALEGGGINCRNHCSPSIDSNQISGNTAGTGGGIYCGDESSPGICGNAIAGNVATSDWCGGIYCEGSSPRIIDCTITGNSGPNGAVHCRNQSCPAIVSCEITDNDGGGIYCWDGSSPSIERCIIAGNHAGDGGGVYCYGGSSPAFETCVIAGNNADGWGGGAYCHFHTRPAFVNCTIASNSTAGHATDVIHLGYQSRANVTNSIVWDEVAVDETSVLMCTYSDILGGWPGEGNISAPPQFVDPGSGEYHLSATSPCIDVGTNEGASLEDIDGDPRPWPSEGIVDMGADEHVGGGRPTCAVAYSPENPFAGHVITFDAGAADPDGSVISVEWDFGDGCTATGMIVEHVYTTGGNYECRVTATDNAALRTTCAAEITILPLTCLSLSGGSWHMIALPGICVHASPGVVFDELMPPSAPIDMLSGALHRYDHAGQRYLTYQHFAPSEFGSITAGDGYWLWLFDYTTICYRALPPVEPVTIHFPTSGSYLFGSPRSYDVPVDFCTVRHGDDPAIPFAYAANVWIQDPLLTYDAGAGSYASCGVSPLDTDHYLRAFRGYWLYTFVDDVTLEVPAP